MAGEVASKPPFQFGGGTGVSWFSEMRNKTNSVPKGPERKDSSFQRDAAIRPHWRRGWG